MSTTQPEKTSSENAPGYASVETGNASNPSPENNGFESATDSQLLDKKAERYLREAANIEDVPDAQDQQEMDETLKNEERK